MMLSIQRGKALILAFVCAVAVTACGDDDDPGSDGAENANVERDENRDPLPLQEWWASVGGAGEGRRDLEQRVEAGIAECMRAQGFEYTPVEPHPATDPASTGPWSLPPQQFAEEHGYGLFTLQGTPGVDDPNGDLIATMSETERDNYNTGLAAEGGCREQAYEQEFESGNLNEDLFALEEEVVALEERVREDGSVQEAAQGWAECMANANESYTATEDPIEAPEIISARFEEVLPEVAAYAERESFPTVDGLMIHRMRGMSLSTSDSQTVADLQQFEIDVATTDYDCRAAYDNARYDVQFGLEEQFMEDNAELLDTVAQGLGVSGGG